MPTLMTRPPPGHPTSLGLGGDQSNYGVRGDEYGETFSRSSSHSPPDGIDELWCDPEELLNIPIYDSLVESQADPLFPSPHKFNLMVQDYLKNLSPKKREKALLTQKMYDAVLNVLNDPKDTSTKTAQFRFWAKKMFQLTNFGDEKIVCHDHKPVAVKEQIYEVLCHCHGQAGHGGRDKTSAQVRRYYSWIPKEIIARFVRDCPFCQSRRTQSSAGFSNMSESQAFLISLQTSDTQLANKRPVSLAQARANAAALGHKPYRRPSIRTIDSCRSRRGSAVSDDGYIHYLNEVGNPSALEISSSMSNYDESQDSLYVTSDSYEFPGNNQYNNQQPQQQHPPMPRRASSYHEQSLLNVKPLISSESMLRRNSESNISLNTNLSHPGSGLVENHMIYSNPPSANPDLLAGNQFLSVPGGGYYGGGGGLSRTTSSSSLNSLNDDSLSISEIGYFTQHLQLNSSSSSHSSGMLNDLEIDNNKIDVWREGNIYPISGTTTPLDGNFSFPLTNLPGMEINYFPNSTLDYNSISAPPSTYMLPVPEFNFPSGLNPIDDPIQLPESWNSNSTSMNFNQNLDQDQATLDAVAAVQQMFDSNNIFALGEAAGMSQDQIIDMHNTDPSMLDLSDLRNQLSPSDTPNIIVNNVEIPGQPKTEQEINAELEAISILALATQDYSTSPSNQLNYSLTSQFQVSDESIQQMEYVLAQAVEDARKGSMTTPTVYIEQPHENISNNNIFLFNTGDMGFPPIMVEEPKSELLPQDMDFSQWPEYTLSQ